MDFYMSFSRGSPPLSSSAWPTEPRQRPKLNHIYVPINQLIHHGGVRVPSVGGGGGEAGPGFPRSERVTMTSLAWRRDNERASSIIHPCNKLINGVNEEEQRRQKKIMPIDQKRHLEASGDGGIPGCMLIGEEHGGVWTRGQSGAASRP